MVNQVHLGQKVFVEFRAEEQSQVVVAVRILEMVCYQPCSVVVDSDDAEVAAVVASVAGTT